ncbi:MAG: hypothetical protein A2X45_10470 [Lentisphaerae bacterium GWF2_50_93]|nr:MAG: hypothetical protein A2X45_10470 [Lentisphaerae bacterium GWF2_50_93]
MATAVITSKGQVTIPIEIRNFLCLGKGDKIDFRIMKKRTIAITPVNCRTSDVFGILSGKTRKKASDSEIKMKMTEHFKKNFK